MPNAARDRRREIRRLRRRIGWQDIPVTYDRTDLTGGGHVPLFVNFCRAMGLDDAIARRLHLDRRERSDGFATLQHLWILTEMILHDIDRVDNVSVLGIDALVPYLHGLDRLPTAQALRDFLEGFTDTNVRELLAVNRDVLSAATAKSREPLTVSFLSDDTVLTVYGRQEGAEVGYNPKKKGRASYLARLCVIPELDAVTHAELAGGKERPTTRQREFFDAAFAGLPANVWVAGARLDRGHFAEETCEYFEVTRPMTYWLKVRVNPQMRSDWHGLPDGLFEPIPGDDREIARVRYRPRTWKVEREFVILRRLIPPQDSAQARLLDEPEYEFEAIVTNDEESPAIEVWRAYNAGADVENRIRELKYEYFIDRIGSGTYLANAAHFTWKVIVHNLMSMFKRLVLPEGWARRSLKTVRAYLLRIPGVVRRVGRGVAVALPAAFCFAGAMSEASRNVLALALGGSG